MEDDTKGTPDGQPQNGKSIPTADPIGPKTSQSLQTAQPAESDPKTISKGSSTPVSTAASQLSSEKNNGLTAEHIASSGKELGFWCLFWLGVFLLLLVLVTKAGEWGIKEPTKLMIGIAIFSTAIYAHFSILLPFLRPRAGIERCALLVFFLIVVIGVVSFALSVYYLDVALHSSPEWLNLESIQRSLSNSWFSFLRTPVVFFSWIHTFVYAVIFFVTDAIIARQAIPTWRRGEFRRIAYFIDLPMVAGIAYANYVNWIIRKDDPTEFFLAGAVSLQLFAANIAFMLYSLDMYLSHNPKLRTSIASMSAPKWSGVLRLRSRSAPARAPLSANESAKPANTP